MSGRVVLVTGGADGIGWAICRRFAQAGDRVVIADLDGDRASARAADLGEGALGLACDVADPRARASAVEAGLTCFGGLNVLVNNAGIIDSVGTPAVDTPLETFRRVLDVNLAGAHGMALAAKAAMGARGGTVVNLASAAGFVATPLRNGYGASKAGIVGLTLALGRAWAPEGVRVVAVAPGYIRTPLLDALIVAGKVDPARVEARVPLGRLGRPEEIAEAVFHVASGEAACRPGSTLVADGGFLAAGGGGGPFAPFAAASLRTRPRTTFVAGADTPRGAALAAAFAAAGDRVALFGRDGPVVDAMAAGFGAASLSVAGEPADEAAVGRAVDAATAAWGGVDVLVTAAGDGEGAPVAAFVAAKVAGAAILRAGGGAVVQVASSGASPDEEAATAGIVMLGRSLACEWASHGVRVNTITAPPDADPARVVATALFLASDAASYVIGSQIVA